MIQVFDLIKRYGALVALDHISFNVSENTVVGFLGCNGAGKTTAMRILACYLPADSGKATVGGYDVFTQPLEVRRILGYLPENVPLYKDMRVQDYLRYMATLKNIARSKRDSSVDKVIEICWLNEVRRKVIQTLSKGFRQRVGLAETLLADPKVLILDEPTVGLDPVQIVETRKLIQELGKEKTILLSTHILSEVEQVCSHVIIIHYGRIVANDKIENLAPPYVDLITLETTGPVDEVEKALQRIEGVEKVSKRPDGHGLLVKPVPKADPREAISTLMQQQGWHIFDLHAGRQTLEKIYVNITQAEKVV